MLDLAQEILSLTEELRVALSQDRTEDAAVLLDRRGELVARLGAGLGKGVETPSAVEEVLARVRELDAVMTADLVAQRDAAGRELSRLREHTNKHGAEAPCIIDRQA